MATKSITVRMDEGLYAQFRAFCEETCLPVSALMSSFAAQTVREWRVPFVIGTPVEARDAQARMQRSLERVRSASRAAGAEASEQDIAALVDEALGRSGDSKR